jgi:exosortase
VALALWVYGPVLLRLGALWRTHDYAAYMPLVPAFSAFALWERRAALRCARAGRPLLGAPFAILALALLAAARASGEAQPSSLTLETASILLMLWGATLALGGPRLGRDLAFPLGFLALALPFTRSAPTSLAMPLQHLTAATSAAGLQVVGVPVIRDGLLLHLPALTLRIDKGCSGWTYLWTLVVFAVALAYVTRAGFRRRALLVAAALPFALLANIVRVVALVALGWALDGGAITGAAHEWFGHAVYWVATALFALLALRPERGRPSPERA